MAGSHRTGLPDVDALITAHEVERGTLNATIAVSQAENVVATATASPNSRVCGACAGHATDYRCAL